MRTARHGVLGLLGALQVSPAATVAGPPVHPPAYEEHADEASRVVVFEVFERTGKCLVNADPKASMALVTTTPGTPANDRAFTKVQRHIQDCLSIGVEKTDFYGLIEVQWNGTALVGAVAQALYRVQFASRPPSSLGIPASVAPILPPAGAENDEQVLASYAFAQCLANRHPDAVRSLVLSKVGSSDEGAAFAQVQQFVGPCVYGPVKADRNSLRLMLAQALYRWSITAAATSATGARP